eukprot:2741431-Pleurochrysis_carterae.AAC.3
MAYVMHSTKRAIVCSWLMVLDESMVRWMGRDMPGLLVVQRKPASVGLELHTLCYALCRVLTWQRRPTTITDRNASR